MERLASAAVVTTMEHREAAKRINDLMVEQSPNHLLGNNARQLKKDVDGAIVVSFRELRWKHSALQHTSTPYLGYY